MAFRRRLRMRRVGRRGACPISWQQRALVGPGEGSKHASSRPLLSLSGSASVFRASPLGFAGRVVWHPTVEPQTQPCKVLSLLVTFPNLCCSFLRRPIRPTSAAPPSLAPPPSPGRLMTSSGHQRRDAAGDPRPEGPRRQDSRRTQQGRPGGRKSIATRSGGNETLSRHPCAIEGMDKCS